MRKYDVDKIKQIALEIKKCKEDPIYFIETYIKHPEFNIEIKLREKQKEIINTILKKHKVIINGSRQTGKTTIIILLALWLVCFFPNYHVFFMSKKGESTAELIKEFIMFYHVLPNWLKPKLVKDNTYTKEFSNGSFVKGITVAKGKDEEAGRGMKGGFIFIDEVAFFDADISKVYTALLPTTSYMFRKYEQMGYPYGLVLVSTPAGTYGNGRFFFEMWTKAVAGKIDFVPIRFHWSDVPDYRHDPFWIDKQRESFPDEREFNQEYELLFRGSKEAFFPDSIIEKLQVNHYEPIDEKYLAFGTIRIYEEIDPNKFYLIGIDTASGYASDYSAIVITDYETGLPIAEYENKVPLEDFKQDILSLIEKLNLKNFLLIPENNGIGSSISQWLASIDLKRYLYYTEKTTGKRKQKIPGLSTNTQTRPLMLESLYETVSENAEIIKPEILKQELIAIEKRGQRIEAVEPMHDDLVFAYAFTCYVRQYGNIRIAVSKEAIQESKKKLTNTAKKLYQLKKYGDSNGIPNINSALTTFNQDYW